MPIVSIDEAALDAGDRKQEAVEPKKVQKKSTKKLMKKSLRKNLQGIVDQTAPETVLKVDSYGSDDEGEQVREDCEERKVQRSIPFNGCVCSAYCQGCNDSESITVADLPTRCL